MNSLGFSGHGTKSEKLEPPRFSFFTFLFSLTAVHSSLFTPQRTGALRRSAILAEPEGQRCGLSAPSGVALYEYISLVKPFPSGTTLHPIFLHLHQHVIRPRWGRGCGGGPLRYQDTTPAGGLSFSLFDFLFSLTAFHSSLFTR